MADKKSTSFIQFDYCNLCKISHKRRKKHVYSKRHQEILNNILKKFSKKVEAAKVFVETPAVEALGWENGAEFWCYFCEVSLHTHRREVDCTIKCGGLIQHVASDEHAKKTGAFFWKNIIDKTKKSSVLLEAVDAERFSNKTDITLSTYRKKMQSRTQQMAGTIRSQTNHQQTIAKLNTTQAMLTQISTKQSQIYQKEPLHHVNARNPAHREANSANQRRPVRAVAVGLTSIARPKPQSGESTDKEEGNVFTDATPPWLRGDTRNDPGSGEIGPSTAEYQKHLKREEKKKLPANRVGAKFDHESQTSASWLPSFGGVWHKGRRLNSKIQFDRKHGIRGPHSGEMGSEFRRQSMPTSIVPYRRKVKTDVEHPSDTSNIRLIATPLIDQSPVSEFSSMSQSMMSNQSYPLLSQGQLFMSSLSSIQHQMPSTNSRFPSFTQSKSSVDAGSSTSSIVPCSDSMSSLLTIKSEQPPAGINPRFHSSPQQFSPLNSLPAPTNPTLSGPECLINIGRGCSGPKVDIFSSTRNVTTSSDDRTPIARTTSQSSRKYSDVSETVTSSVSDMSGPTSDKHNVRIDPEESVLVTLISDESDSSDCEITFVGSSLSKDNVKPVRTPLKEFSPNSTQTGDGESSNASKEKIESSNASKEKIESSNASKEKFNIKIKSFPEENNRLKSVICQDSSTETGSVKRSHGTELQHVIPYKRKKKPEDVHSDQTKVPMLTSDVGHTLTQCDQAFTQQAQVSSHQRPIMSSNPRPPMSSNPRPPMSSNQRLPVSSNPRPPMSYQIPPMPATPISSNPRPPVSYQRPPMASNHGQPMHSNLMSSHPRPPVSSNQESLISSNPRPAVSYQRPPVSSNQRQPMNSNQTFPVQAPPYPNIHTPQFHPGMSQHQQTPHRFPVQIQPQHYSSRVPQYDPQYNAPRGPQYGAHQHQFGQPRFNYNMPNATFSSVPPGYAPVPMGVPQFDPRPVQRTPVPGHGPPPGSAKTKVVVGSSGTGGVKPGLNLFESISASVGARLPQ